MSNTGDSMVLGVGMYSPTDAARLVGMQPQTAIRWVKGYTYVYQGRERPAEALWALPNIGGRSFLYFLDLIELRWVACFRQAGLSLQRIRRVRDVAAQKLRTNRPFSTDRYTTDHANILERVNWTKRERRLVEPLSKQSYFANLMEPFLHSLDYERGTASRWWWLGKEHRLYLDPKINLGRPSVLGIRADILAGAYEAELKDAGKVARWFEIEPRDVLDAVKFSEKLAA